MTVGRDVMTQDIVSKLSALGLSPSVGQGADITLDREFLDAKWSTGEKKIEFHSSAFLDETARVLYYWESTKDIGGGISFGASSESYSQSGMTLMRKVKAVQYGPEGQVYEYDLDLGQIAKTFKDVAKEHGWKFKVVMSRQKAAYPAGFVAPGVAPPVAESPAVPPPAVVAAAPVPPPPAVPPASAGGGTTPKKGCLSSTAAKVGIGVVIGVVAVIGILIWIGLAMGDSDSSTNGGSGAENAEVTEASTNYKYGGYDLTLMLAGEEQVSGDSYTHNLGMMGSLYQDIYFEDDAENPDPSKVVALRLTNFQVTDGPALGTYAGISEASIAAMDASPIMGTVGDDSVTWDTTPLSTTNSSWSNTIYLAFRITDVGTFTYGPDYSGVISYDTSYRQAGIKSEDLMFAVSYDLEVETADGTVYRARVETDKIAGDIVNEPSVQLGNRTFEVDGWSPFGE